MNFRIVITFFVLLFLFSNCKKDKYAAIGLQNLKDFGDNPGNLSAFYYVPENASPNMPLVVVLHGCTQNAKDVAELTDWNLLADKYGFYVLYPEQKSINNISNCFNWFNPNDYEKNQGENASIKNMILAMQTKFNTNSSKTVITGLSAGGAMSMVMVSVYPDMFYAGAILSGGAYKAANSALESIGALAGNVSKSAEDWGNLVRNQNSSYSGSYCKLAIFHGENDNVVKFSNAQEIVKQWTNVTQSDINNSIETIDFDGITDIKRNDYYNVNAQLMVSKFSIANLGHAVAVNPGDGEKEGGKEGIYGKDKDFFSTYWAADFFNLLP